MSSISLTYSGVPINLKSEMAFRGAVILLYISPLLTRLSLPGVGSLSSPCQFDLFVKLAVVEEFIRYKYFSYLFVSLEINEGLFQSRNYICDIQLNQMIDLQHLN